MAKGGSTLPPKKEGAKPRARKVPDDDIPKCGLPPRKRKAKAPPKGKAATVKEGLTVAPVDTSGTAPAEEWDSARVAEEAKRAVAARSKRKETVPIDPIIDRAIREELEPGPMGGKLKRRRKPPVPEPVPEVSKDPAPAPRPRLARDLLAEIRRPSVPVTPEIFEDICDLVSEGIPLRQICRHADMPSQAAVYRWLEDVSDESEHARRVARYARARAMGYDAIAAETLEIVDDGSNDYMERTRDDGSTEIVLDREHIQRSKLRAEHRLKLLACWDPKRYGAQLKLADPNGDRLDRGGMSTSDIAIWIAKIATAAGHDGGPAGPLLEG